MKRAGDKAYFYILALSVILFDQLVKFLIKKTEVNAGIIDLGFFSLTHINNYGAGFGVLQGQKIILILVAFAFIVITLLFYEKIEKDKILQSGFSLLLGGTISNLIDRLSYGFVIDYFDFKIWPVFNIADSAITIGAVLIIYYYMVKDKKKK